MNYRQLGNSLMAGLVLAAVAVPAANADSGPWIRWKQGYRQPVQRVDYRRGHGDSGAGPAIAGFIGGLVLGSQLHSHTVVEYPPQRRVIVEEAPPVEYEYYDPYTDQEFSSLDECYAQAQYDDYPIVVQQIDIRTGGCVNTYQWSGDRWNSRGRDFDFRSYYNQRGYNGGAYDRRGDGRGWNNDRRGTSGRDESAWNHGGQGNGGGRWNDNGRGNGGWNRNDRGNGRGNGNGHGRGGRGQDNRGD
jgi:hypothetical protein